MRSSQQTTPFHARMAAAAAYLAAAVGGDVDYVKLLKLIYLADRESMDRHGRPITYDDYLALQMGPVSDDTYQVLEHREESAEHWKDAIQIVGEKGRRVVLPRIGMTEAAKSFSKVEKQILDEMVRRHGMKSRARLISETHRLREWQQVRKVHHRKKITYEDMLMALGRTKQVATEMAREIRAYRSMRSAPDGVVPKGSVRETFAPGGFELGPIPVASAAPRARPVATESGDLVLNG